MVKKLYVKIAEKIRAQKYLIAKNVIIFFAIRALTFANDVETIYVTIVIMIIKKVVNK
ncbi:MAG: hypothetical protein ACFE94_11485 [Candidatus Hodarchaeota archaeon]